MEKIHPLKQVVKQFSTTSTQTDQYTSLNPIFEQIDGLQNIYPSLRILTNTIDHTHLEINLKSPFSTRHQHELLLVIKFHQQFLISYNNDDFTTENQKQIECILKSGSTDLFDLILQFEVLLEGLDRQFIQERQIEHKEVVQLSQVIQEQVPVRQEKQHNLQDLQNLVVRQNQEEQYDFQIKPMPSLSSQKQSSNETSRFKSDFDLLQRIGAGTFGQVFAARNRLDGNIYAIKRILLDYTNDKYCQKTINEAILLSRIYHPNIVRYYQSWTENIDANDEQVHCENEDGSEYEDEEEEEDEYIYEDPELGVNVDFVDPDPFAADSYDENDIQIDWADDKNQYESDQKATPIITPMRVREVKQRQYLFIQMEYCVGETIKDKIDAGSLNSEQKKNVIRQILEALNYLHTKKYIHRDLKPQNIFLDGNLNVKLGDFGLATEVKAEIQHEKLQLSRAQSVSEGTDSAYMTQGCGTFMYLAPEQQHSRYYDAKADMFSLGIIIFEIYYRFKTDMEKNKILSNLKEGRFPDDFDSRVGLEDTDLREKIKNLINQNPQKRPDSKQLLSDYSDKQFQNMIRSLANPNHSNYQALIQALFDCGSLGQLLPFQEQLFQKALNKRPEIFFSDYQKTLNVFKDRIEYIFKMRGGIQLDISHIIPIQKHKYFSLTGQSIEYTIQKDNQLITQDGSLVSYSDNMIMPAIHEIKRIPFKNFRRYSFGQIQHSLRSQSQQKEKCAQFDIITEYTSDLPMLELINIGIEVVKQFNSYSNFELRISHGQFVELILKELGYDVSMFIRLQTNQIYHKIILFLNNKSESAKNLIYQTLQDDFGIPTGKITKFLNFLALKIDYSDKKGFVETIKGYFNTQLEALNSVLKSLEIISNYLSLLNIPIKIYFDTFQNNDLRHYFSGIKFEIVELYFENSMLGDPKIFSESKLQSKVIQHKQSYIIGGDYSYYLQNRQGCGVSIYYDRIHFNKYNKYLSQNSEKIFKPLVVSGNCPPISHQEVDLVITHENCQFQALQLALECWEHKLSTIILKDKDFVQKQMFRKKLFEMIISVQNSDRKSSDPCPLAQISNTKYKVKIVFLDQKSAEQEFDDIFLKKIKKIRIILNEEGPYQEVKKFFR